MSQKSRIRELLLCGMTIMPNEARRWFGCDRLASCIGKLRKYEKMNIKTTMVKVGPGKSVAKYHLIREEAKGELFLDGVREAL